MINQMIVTFLKVNLVSFQIHVSNLWQIKNCHLFESELWCETRFLDRLGVPIGSVHLNEDDDDDGFDDDGDDADDGDPGDDGETTT